MAVYVIVCDYLNLHAVTHFCKMVLVLNAQMYYGVISK